MNKYSNFVFFLCVIFIACTPIKINKINKKIKNKYWNAYYDGKPGGRGWYFSNNFDFKEFHDENGKRKSIEYGDIEWEGFKYEVRGDTLYLLDYNGYKFLILKITKDSLLLKDVSLYKYVCRDTLLYIKSKDQSSYPLPLGK